MAAKKKKTKEKTKNKANTSRKEKKLLSASMTSLIA